MACDLGAHAMSKLLGACEACAGLACNVMAQCSRYEDVQHSEVMVSLLIDAVQEGDKVIGSTRWFWMHVVEGYSFSSM